MEYLKKEIKKMDISSRDKTFQIFRLMFLHCLQQVIRTFTISGKHPKSNRQPSDGSEKHVTTISCLFKQGIAFWSKPDTRCILQLISRSIFPLTWSRHVGKIYCIVFRQSLGSLSENMKWEWLLLSYSSRVHARHFCLQ